VTTLFLEIQHHLGEVFDLPILPTTSLTDLPIDAEDTPKPAVREENRPGTSPATEGSLLSMMWVKSRYHEAGRSLTKPLFALETPCPTLSRTETATLHDLPKIITSALQLTTPV
jgi:hypothetical protein